MPATPVDAGGEKRPRRISAILVSRDDRGRVLLVRQRGGAYKGHWLLPGGGLEVGETEEDALHREVREETGLDARNVRYLARYVFRSGGYENECVMYAAETRGEPRIGHDGEDVAWREVDPATAHPVLLLELLHAGLIDLDEAEIRRRAEAMDVEMVRLG